MPPMRAPDAGVCKLTANGPLAGVVVVVCAAPMEVKTRELRAAKATAIFNCRKMLAIPMSIDSSK